MTLEVRASNSVAQNLYRKYTFKEMGVRRRYYSDNGEDALVMWTDALDSESFQTALDQNERKLAERLGSAEGRLGDLVWSLPKGWAGAHADRRAFARLSRVLRAAGDAAVHQRQGGADHGRVRVH